MALTHFDDAAPQMLREALELAAAELGEVGRSHVVRKAIAKRIIEAANRGEHDPFRLRDFGLGRGTTKAANDLSEKTPEPTMRIWRKQPRRGNGAGIHGRLMDLAKRPLLSAD